MTSVSSFVLFGAVNSLLRMGMLWRPTIPLKAAASCPCRRPPMRLVSPSRTRSTPSIFRLRKVGTLSGLWSEPTFRFGPIWLNSADISSVISPLAFTFGVIWRLTPTVR